MVESIPGFIFKFRFFFKLDVLSTAFVCHKAHKVMFTLFFKIELNLAEKAHITIAICIKTAQENSWTD
jgi:hypothetical protein